MIAKSKNIIIAILSILLLIIISEIYASSMGFVWISVIDVISYVWEKFWWLIIIIVIGISIKKE